jgi:hypothetical protein
VKIPNSSLPSATHILTSLIVSATCAVNCMPSMNCGGANGTRSVPATLVELQRRIFACSHKNLTEGEAERQGDDQEDDQDGDQDLARAGLGQEVADFFADSLEPGFGGGGCIFL